MEQKISVEKTFLSLEVKPTTLWLTIVTYSYVKKGWILKNVAKNFSRKNFSIFRGKTNNTVVNNCYIFLCKIGKKLGKSTENVNKNNKN